MKILKCQECGKIVIVEKDCECPTKCCGEVMAELKANETDGAKEKHVPEVKCEGNKVTAQVGSVIHPMEEKHYIQFILLETAQGYQIKHLNPGDEPKAVFYVADGDKAVAVYELCNLHGLWKAAL